jgi:hypothetical protein
MIHLTSVRQQLALDMKRWRIFFTVLVAHATFLLNEQQRYRAYQESRRLLKCGFPTLQKSRTRLNYLLNLMISNLCRDLTQTYLCQSACLFLADTPELILSDQLRSSAQARHSGREHSHCYANRQNAILSTTSQNTYYPPAHKVRTTPFSYTHAAHKTYLHPPCRSTSQQPTTQTLRSVQSPPAP